MSFLQLLLIAVVQGITEFLPISSSGHLVIVPEWLGRFGVDIGPPDLATSAVLHLGTLAAVLAYFRDDIGKVLRLRRNAEGRRIALLVAIVCSLLVSLTAVGLAEWQQSNRERDLMRNVLMAAGLYDPDVDIEEAFGRIELHIVDLETGEYVTSEDIGQGTYTQQTAATDPKLVPYGAMTATFYTGVGCLLAPSVLFLAVRALF